jgi:hypothetical protein
MTAKKTPFQTDILSILSEFSENFGMPGTMANQAGGVLKAQAQMMSGMEEIARDWLQRRNEANELAIRAAERICSSGDPSAMMVAYFDWLGGALRRLSDDTTALSEKAFAVTTLATQAGASGAAAPSSKAKAKTAKAAKTAKTAKTKPKAKRAKPQAKPALQAAQPSAQQTAAARPVEPRQRLAG